MILIVMLVAIPAAGIIVNAGFQQRSEAINSARRDTQKLAESIVNEQQEMIATARQIMDSLSQRPEVQQKNADKVTSILREIHKISPDFSNIFISDRTGLVWATAVPTKPPFIISDRRYFKNTLASGQLSSGEYVVSRATNRPSFNVGYPLKDDRGDTVGVICIGFLLEKYARLLERSHLPIEASFGLFDHQGVFLFRGTEAEKYIGKNANPVLFKEIQDGPDEWTAITTSVAIGDERIITTRKLRLEGESTPYMYLRVGIPLKSVLATANTQMLRNLILFSCVLVLAVLFAGFVGERSIVARIALLKEASRKLADGDYQTKVAALVTGGELGKLAGSFDVMAEKLLEREETLRKTEERFRSFVESANEIVFSLSAEGIFTYVSPNWQDAFGYDLKETIGKTFISFVHSDDIILCSEKLCRVLETGVKQQSHEVRVRHTNGAWIWYAVSGSRLQDAERNEYSFLGIGRDITERMQAEELLTKNEERLRVIFETSQAGIMLVEPNGTVTFANTRMAEMFGCTMDELIGSAYPDHVHHTEREACETSLLLLDSGEIDHVYYERHYLRYDGSDFWGYLSGRRLEAPDGTTQGLVFIIVDVTDQRNAMIELHQAKEAAEAANETKDRFLMNMSHELRTPMNGVLGMIQLALFENLSEKQRQYLETAIDSGKGLVRILNDILDLTKAEVHKLTIHNEPFDLRPTVLEVVRILDLEARRKGLALNCTIATEVPERVTGDRLRLQQVLTNLVANAVKFTERGEVSVALTCGSGSAGSPELVYTVTDTGVGIPADKQHLLFQPFSQVDDSLTRPYGGTGLGLVISREIVERMGGRITFTSKAGEGSVFTVRIPCAINVPLTALSAPHVEQKLVVPVTTGSSKEEQQRILLVEDDPVNRAMQKIMLERSGFQTSVASNGLQAVELWEREAYDLIVMDVQMPVMNGIEATEIIRKKESARGGHIPILGLTAHAYRNDVNHCLAAGMDSYLTKPVDLNELIATIKELCNDGTVQPTA
jgi:PAS domain S-box-containing protein